MENNYNQGNEQKIEARLRDARKVVSNMGSLLGKTICYLQVDNVDLSHREKELTNQHPRLVEPLLKYMVNTVLVSSQRLLVINDEIFIEFNEKPELRAKIVQEPKFFAEATDNSAIEEACVRAKNNQTPLFFADRKRLTDEANFRNKQEAEKAEVLANDFLAQMTMLKELIKGQQQSCDEYYRQYGL